MVEGVKSRRAQGHKLAFLAIRPFRCVTYLMRSHRAPRPIVSHLISRTFDPGGYWLRTTANLTRSDIAPCSAARRHSRGDIAPCCIATGCYCYCYCMARPCWPMKPSLRSWPCMHLHVACALVHVHAHIYHAEKSVQRPAFLLHIAHLHTAHGSTRCIHAWHTHA